MSWRLDWILLATGLVSLGLIRLHGLRQNLFSLLGEGASSEGSSALSMGSYLIPGGLLLAFAIRLFLRIATKNWK